MFAGGRGGVRPRTRRICDAVSIIVASWVFPKPSIVKWRVFITSQFLWVGSSGAAQWGRSGPGSLTRRRPDVRAAVVWRLDGGWVSLFQDGALHMAAGRSFRLLSDRGRSPHFLTTQNFWDLSSVHPSRHLAALRMDSSEDWGRSHNVFHDLALKITRCHFHSILLEGSHQFSSHSWRQKSNFTPRGHCIKDFMSIFLKPS